MLKTEDCAPFLAMVPVVDYCRFFWRLLAGLRHAIDDGGGLGSVRLGLGLGERSDPCWRYGTPLELLKEDEHHDVSEYAEFHFCTGGSAQME